MLDRKVDSILKYYSEEKDLNKSYVEYIEALKKRLQQEEDMNKIERQTIELLKAKIERLEAENNNLRTQLLIKKRGFFSKIFNI